MSQKYLNLLDILQNSVAWKDDWNRNIAILQDALRTLKVTLQSPGDTTTPYLIQIQLQDATGNDKHEQFLLRVRVSDYPLYSVATNATVIVDTGTTLIDSYTPNKDIVVKSDANGLVKLVVHDSQPESFRLLIGDADVSPMFANYNNPLDVSVFGLFNTASNPIYNAAGQRLYR